MSTPSPVPQVSPPTHEPLPKGLSRASVPIERAGLVALHRGEQRYFVRFDQISRVVPDHNRPGEASSIVWLLDGGAIFTSNTPGEVMSLICACSEAARLAKAGGVA